MARFRTARGVTLIELLVTLAVAAILLGVAAPSFQGAIARNRAAGLTNELVGALNLARSEAIKRGRRVTICKSANTDTAIDNVADSKTGPTCSTDNQVGWQDGWLIFVDGNNQGTVDSSDIRLRVGQPSTGNGVIDGGGAHDNPTDGRFDLYVSYQRSGASQGNGGADHDGGWAGLHLCTPPNQQRNIVIGQVGRIRVERTEAECE